MSALPGLTGAAAPQRAYGLWHYVWKLVRLRLVLMWSGLRRARLRRKIVYVFAALGVIAVLALVFTMSTLLLSFLRDPYLARQMAQAGVDPRVFLAAVPTVVLSGTFLAVLLTSFGVLLQAMYLAGDMDFLLSAPVPIRAVFVTKLLQAIVPNFSIVAVFALPVLLGLGVSAKYNLLYYPLAIAVLAALALAAAGLASVLVMAVVRVFPARRVAEVLAFVGAITSMLCSQVGNFTNMARLGGTPVSGTQLPGALAALAQLNSPLSPLAWGGLGLLDIGEGRWLTGFLYLALMLGLAAGVFWIGLTTAERWYYSGWAAMQGSVRRKKPARGARAARAAPLVPVTSSAPVALVRWLPAPLRAVIAKDFLVLRRDLRNMSQLVGPLVFGLVYAVLLARNAGQVPAGRGEAPSWFMTGARTALSYGNVGIALFVSWSMLSRLAMAAFSQESRNYWILKVSPIRVNQLLLAKYLVAYLPALALGLAFLLLASAVQGLALAALPYEIPVMALSIAGAAGLNLAFGVRGANFTWEDPRQMIRTSAGCAGSLVSMGYLFLSVVFFFAPPVLLAALGYPELYGQLLGLLLGGALGLACAAVPVLLVAARVPRLGED